VFGRRPWTRCRNNRPARFFFCGRFAQIFLFLAPSRVHGRRSFFSPFSAVKRTYTPLLGGGRSEKAPGPPSPSLWARTAPLFFGGGRRDRGFSPPFSPAPPHPSLRQAEEKKNSLPPPDLVFRIGGRLVRPLLLPFSACKAVLHRRRFFFFE